jgi:hypothetical protein
MSAPPPGWAPIAAFCATLPGTELVVNYYKPEARVGGRAFAGVSRDPGSFFLTFDPARIRAMCEAAPDLFWRTPRMISWGFFYVLYAGADRDEVRQAIREAHGWAVAQPPLRRR